MVFAIRKVLSYLRLMDLPHFFEPYEDATSLVLSSNTHHHIHHVLRMREGNEALIVNGKGNSAHIRLTQVSKKNCDYVLLSQQQHKQPHGKLHIAISFTKNLSRIEWFLEKACEIGIHVITPLHTHRTEKLFFKRDRFEKILQTAMLQSKQFYLPILHDTTSLEEVCKQEADVKCIAWCGEAEKKPLNTVLQKDKKTIILIGPEGDFTQEEVTLAQQQGYTPVSMGDTRLRTETAGVYACVAYNTAL